MTDAILGAALLVVLAAAGWRLGMLRFGLVMAAMGLGAAFVFVLGPLLHVVIVVATGWNTWLGAGLAWGVAYVAVASSAACLLTRVVRQPPSRRERTAGAVLGMVLGTFASWILYAPSPAVPGPGEVDWVQAPFATLRALRVLRGVSPDEARWLAERPEVKAVAESESILRMMRDETILQKIHRASGGDRWALLALAADPGVKQAMDDPAFLERVRRVDLPLLAEAVVARRAGTFATIQAPPGSGASPSESGAWRLGYALGSRLREGILELNGANGTRPGKPQ